MEGYFRPTEVSKILGPPQLTNFMQTVKNVEENVYHSSQKRPLGKCPNPNIPCESRNLRFGKVSPFGDKVSDILFSSKPIAPLSQYVMDYKPIENSFSTRYGKKVEGYYNSGLHMKKILTMINNEKPSNIIKIPSGVNDKANMNGASPFNFLSCKPRSHENEGTEKKGKSQKERTIFEKIWNEVKVKNIMNFRDFETAFKIYDQENTGRIKAADIKRMCCKFNIAVDSDIIANLIVECDDDKDGGLNYREFLNRMNWSYENSIRKPKSIFCNWKPEPYDADVIEQYKTTSHIIGDHNKNSCQQAAGVATVRTDLPKPFLQKFSDAKNYGDANGRSIMNPDLFCAHGIYENDLSILRDKQEIKHILATSGIIFDDEHFEDIWKITNQNEKAQIGNFWRVLKEKFNVA